MNARSKWLTALVFAACSPSGTSSTGVGNPSASFSLTIVNDEDADASAEKGGSSSGGEASTASAAGASAEAGGGPGESEPGTSGGSSDGVPLERGEVMHAILSLGELRFLACDRSLGDYVVPGPFVVDLVQNLTLPELPNVPGVEGGYCGIDAPLAPATPPAALAGRSLFFDGVRADGVRFLLFANMQATLRVRAVPTSGWRADETPELLWGMRPRGWLNRSEVDSADSELLDGARAIVIDVDRHPLLYALIRARLAGRSGLYPDLNMNQRIDPTERLRELGIGLEDAD